MQTNEQHKRDCEVRYWVGFARRNRKVWPETKERLIKKRGKKAVEKLVEEMNEYRESQK